MFNDILFVRNLGAKHLANDLGEYSNAARAISETKSYIALFAVMAKLKVI